MAMEFRIEYPGAMYHVLNRGDQDIFLDEEDRQKFLATLEQDRWQVHAYCLMRRWRVLFFS